MDMAVVLKLLGLLLPQACPVAPRAASIGIELPVTHCGTQNTGCELCSQRWEPLQDFKRRKDTVRKAE